MNNFISYLKEATNTYNFYTIKRTLSITKMDGKAHKNLGFYFDKHINLIYKEYLSILSYVKNHNSKR